MSRDPSPHMTLWMLRVCWWFACSWIIDGMTIFRCVSIVVTRCYQPEKRGHPQCRHHYYPNAITIIIVIADSGRWLLTHHTRMCVFWIIRCQRCQRCQSPHREYLGLMNDEQSNNHPGGRPPRKSVGLILIYTRMKHKKGHKDSRLTAPALLMPRPIMVNFKN